MACSNILHSHHAGNSPIPDRSNGSYHRTTQQMRFQCYPHNHWPWMLQSSDLPTLHYKYLWTGNCSIISWLCVQMVRPPHKDHQRPRSSLYFPLWKSHHKEAWDRTKFVYHIPSSNWWTFWMEKPMDRTIPSYYCHLSPRRLVLLDCHCINSTQ